ncbi:hypothetical protein Aeqsu_1010 [Aequorivita sublithincola DSM 14238]|uniref:Outer membrane protein beta-barrel domain-containing protein n=1 Tax=Aequorivita sublithincola (strain DSM 14238 / LMG 21431 / ACAM 643 / 9-3) TaxID=746697 RepID=I3YU43_AEQSU|nr:hypothetical protein [Aequorivita sublithincola]AFL80511.1 hypothetical protein Aeqsu_1010 [Aequorivita sublithincola DSM 14238]
MRFFIFFLLSFSSFSQTSRDNDSWWSDNYNSVTTMGINGNYDSRFGNDSEDKIQKGVAVEMTTLHGIFLFDYLSLSAGLGIDWNSNRTFWSMPILGDLRIYFHEHGFDNSPFVFLQMGKNVKIGDVFVEGRPVKIGAGITLGEDENLQYVLEIFKKFKEAVFVGETGYYEVTSFGASFGIKF